MYSQTCLTNADESCAVWPEVIYALWELKFSENGAEILTFNFHLSFEKMYIFCVAYFQSSHERLCQHWL